MQLFSLDQMLPADHRARSVWAFVKALDLEPFYCDFEVTDHTAGRTAIAPEILVGLWLLATLDGIGSARELARRCEADIPYLWMLGTVRVNYHTLSDFRVQHGPRLERLLVDTVAALVEGGLVPLETIAQDGMRVRASAGSSSFRRKPTLEKLQQAAQEHVDRLKQEAESEAARLTGDARRQAAAERAARERQERLDEALRQHEQLSRQREQRKKGDGETTRVSTTDPEARKMKMANGGYDPAYNVQFATDAEARVIVGVEVTNAGTDGGELPSMLDKIRQDYGRTPQQALVDSAYATQDSVTVAESAGTRVVSTIPRGEQLQLHGRHQLRLSPGRVRLHPFPAVPEERLGALLQLMPPLRHLRRVDPKPARQLARRPLPTHRRQRHLRLERGAKLPPHAPHRTPPKTATSGSVQ